MVVDYYFLDGASRIVLQGVLSVRFIAIGIEGAVGFVGWGDDE